MDHCHTKRGHQGKLEYLLRFTGDGAEHDMWQDDVSSCAELVQEYWDCQTVTQRLHAAQRLYVLPIEASAQTDDEK